MAFQIIVLPSAKSDIQSSADWYESQQSGLGKKFKHQIVKAIDGIGHPVKGYGLVHKNLSRVFVEKFPYCIYFTVDNIEQQIIIHAVLHEKQNRESVLVKRGLDQ